MNDKECAQRGRRRAIPAHPYPRIGACASHYNNSYTTAAHDEDAARRTQQLVKALPSDRTDQSFSIAVLPWGTRRRRSIANAHGSKSSDEDLAIGPISITNQIAGSLLPAASFRELICDPFRGRMCCDAEPQNLSSTMPHDHRASEMRSSVRRKGPSPQYRRHDCGETSSNLATAGLCAPKTLSALMR